MSQERALPDANLPRFEGGKQLMTLGLVAGVAGLALTALGYFIGDPQKALLSYLIAVVYWLGLAIGGLTLVMANNTAGARWNVTIRRIGETMGATIPLFALLFIPLLFGAKHIWGWIEPTGMSHEALEKLFHKRAYLNFTSFLIRAGIYFVIWCTLGWSMRAWSLRQDETGEASLTQRMRGYSAPGMLVTILAVTFASFDWLMSLHPLWFSTIFGLYVYAGAFVGSLALLALIVTGLRSAETPWGKLITEDHQHNVGKLLFAFIAFWAYMAFSQYMLIWAGNLPAELTWIIARSKGVWRPVGQLILVGHFLIPFFLLLSRDLKRSPPALAAIAVWVLVIHYVDLYWIVMPAISLDSLGLHWTHLTAFIGVGGLSIAAAVMLLRGGRPVPVKDPYLEDSLRYVQP